jgi:putative redox protein
MGAPTTRRAAVRWEGGLRFRGGETGGPETLLDADGVEAPGPFVALMLAAGACASADVVDILTKMRVVLTAASVELTATRRDEHPRRLLALELVFHLDGSGLTEANATRAVELSISKYCSVLASIAPDVTVTHAVRLG